MFLLLNRYVLINKNPVLITLDNVQKYLNKKIILRDPSHCHAKDDQYCSTCTGLTPFYMTGRDTINIGLFIGEIATGLLNMYMKSTHSLGQDTYIIKDLNTFIYPQPKKSIFYTKEDPIDKTTKIFTSVDLEWEVPAVAVTRSGTQYLVLAHGSVISTEDNKKEPYAFALGTEIPTIPTEVLTPGSKNNPLDKHYVFRYAKDTPFINTNITLKQEETVYKMVKLFLNGNASNLVPLSVHKETLANTFKTNKKIKTSDLSIDLMLATLARDVNDPTKPARETKSKDYKFISCQDLIAISGMFNAGFGPDPIRAMNVTMSKSRQEQNRYQSPFKEAMMM